MAYLLVLACPASMGLMMWLMMRGSRGGGPDEDARIAQLEEEVAALRAREGAEAERLAAAKR